MMREISTAEAPQSIGPFSQGIISGDKIYVSGQGPIDPDTGNVVSDNITEQTNQTLDNVAAILAAADASLSDVVKATVMLRDMSLYDAINKEYQSRMDPPYPARSAIEVVELPVDILVEIEVIAER